MNGDFTLQPDAAADRLYVRHPDMPGRAIVLYPGAGPVQAEFHPVLPLVLVCNEVDSTLVAYRFDPASGALVFAQRRSVLPLNFTGTNRALGFALSADGRFLYLANRGHDSLLTVAIQRGKGKIFPRMREMLATSPTGAPVLTDNGTMLTIPGAPPMRFIVQKLNGGLSRIE